MNQTTPAQNSGAQQPAGFYFHPHKQINWYWDGQNWADKATNDRLYVGFLKAEKEKTSNSKLTTLGVLGIVALCLGFTFFLFSGGDQIANSIGLSLIGLSAGFWITWLAVGAIVREIQKLRS